MLEYKDSVLDQTDDVDVKVNIQMSGVKFKNDHNIESSECEFDTDLEDHGVDVKMTGVNFKNDQSSVSSEDEFDTDLEEHAVYLPTEQEKRIKKAHENAGIGHVTYQDICQTLEIVPIQKIVKQLREKDMNLQHVGLNDLQCKALACALVHNACLLSLDIGNNGLDDECLVYILYVFKENVSLTRLCICNNKIGMAGAMALDEILRESSWIADINLSVRYNWTEAMSVVAVWFNAIFEHKIGYGGQYKWWRKNPGKPWKEPPIHEKLLELSHIPTLAETKTLIRVDRGCKLGDNECAIIAGGIKVNTSLKLLNMSHNQISIQGSKKLGTALGHNKTLQIVDLSWNSIRMEGAVGLLKGVKKNNSILSLNLAMNGLGFEGSIALEELLAENKTLKVLDVSNNRINWEGITYVAKGLKKNKTIEMLQIGHNPINMEGCYDLIKAAQTPRCKLARVELQNVPVNAAVINLADSISRYRKFSLVHGGILDTRDIIGIQKVLPEDPVTILVRYLASIGIRVIDLFRMFDQDNDGYVSKQEVVKGLKKLGAPLNDSDMQIVARRLEKNKKRLISYSYLANGVKDHIRKERMEDKKLEVKEQKKKEERRRILSIELPQISLPRYDDMYTVEISRPRIPYGTEPPQNETSSESPASTTGSKYSQLPPLPSRRYSAIDQAEYSDALGQETKRVLSKIKNYQLRRKTQALLPFLRSGSQDSANTWSAEK